ncbi:GNAT family N-acetyltransferase (plasmid) [Cetobacterium somerae]|uniref:GNAT family N-acetyltransferase n=1 Tax=Cetobacterium somerae TaxID=188913 RepID=UPI002E7BFC6B|nr:GNAT family N-acetyltransferase [Cetobacterium somerae]WVJ02316.1 GNAT family N-acetyltransferase [Cetobacterium somerae]
MIILKMEDKQKWQEKFKLIKNKDVQYTYEYLYVFSKYESAEQILFYFESKNGVVYYPFLKRKIKGTEYYDITSQYGYGGPLYNGEEYNKENLIQEFRRKFDMYCLENKIVSEFIRFHPILRNHLGLENYMECINTSNVVYVDLTKSEEEILKNYKYSNRKSINKAIKLGVITEEENNLDEFIKIYNSTMKRNNAIEYYKFNQNFFKYFIEELETNKIFYFAKKNQDYISTELVLYSENYAHSYLGGTNSDFFSLSPNNLLKHNLIKILQQKGIKYFLLGGGYTKDDGIYKYKESFNEKGIIPFYIGKKIHNQKKYDELVEKNGRKNETNFFPKYRA